MRALEVHQWRLWVVEDQRREVQHLGIGRQQSRSATIGSHVIQPSIAQEPFSQQNVGSPVRWIAGAIPDGFPIAKRLLVKVDLLDPKWQQLAAERLAFYFIGLHQCLPDVED